MRSKHCQKISCRERQTMSNTANQGKLFDSSGGHDLSSRQMCKVQRLRDAHLLVGLLISEARHNHDILAMLPVHGRCHAVLCRQLQRVDHPQDLHMCRGLWPESVLHADRLL